MNVAILSRNKMEKNNNNKNKKMEEKITEKPTTGPDENNRNGVTQSRIEERRNYKGT